MGSNRFYFSLLIHCLLIFAAAFLFFYFLESRNQPSTAAGIGLIALIITFRLIYHVNRTNRILGNFFSYMHERDPTLHYSVKYVEKNFSGLNEALEKLIREFKENRIDLEVQAQYLETILNNVSTGILSFTEHGEVLTINRAALDCLGSEPIKHLSDLNVLPGALGTTLLGMKQDDQLTQTFRVTGAEKRISIYASLIKLKKETVHIIALNDITHQMEEQEILSWKKLIRVINHEVMNSMTPIITLSMAIRTKLSAGSTLSSSGAASPVALEDAIAGATIIEERSKGLVQFIERYKKLTGLPPMNPKQFPAKEMMSSLEQLFKEVLAQKGIEFILPGQCDYSLEADPSMLEQVLINLIKNAEQAVAKSPGPRIELACSREKDGSLRLSILDNGEGIPKDKLEQVFIPFYTTREEGSGIGLSLCRQIIRSHGGSLHLESALGEGTRAVIIL